MKLIHKTKNTKANKQFDKLTYFAGVLLPIMTLPQAYDIWVTDKTQGVSLTTWILYALVSLLFIAFGVRHKERLLISTYIPMFAVEIIIVGGLLTRQ